MLMFGYRASDFEQMLEENMADTIEEKMGFRINLDADGTMG